ncbi:hypothetical protein [Nesterenkonia sp. Act20]|uniref:hypothetical protein n=1 Tax=Nesterenkonia sp. Act20 TaxID=1483432 RepID=UPI001C477CB1|nr:hypothetical protein [Nesterenkonia sp. Act20]
MDFDEDLRERMDKASAALEEQGFEAWYAYSVERSAPSTGGTRLPPDREAVAFSVWCEGADQGPPFSLDGEERGVMPCSEDGQTYEVVTDYPYAAGQLEIETEQGPRNARWAFAVGITPEENASGGDLDVSEDQASEENAFNDLVQKLASDYPDHYSAAELDTDEQVVGEIAFAGEPPAGATALIDESGVNPEVTTDAVASEAQIVALQEEVYRGVVDITDVQAVSTVDAKRGIVDLVIDKTGPVSLGDVERALSNVLQSGPAVTLNDEVIGGPSDPSSRGDAPDLEIRVSKGDVDGGPESTNG